MSEEPESVDAEVSDPNILEVEFERPVIQDDPSPGLQRTLSADMRSSKTWNNIFFTRHNVQDRPFTETISRSRRRLGLLRAFLQTTDASGPSWDVELVQRYCRKQPEISDARIWIDDRIHAAEDVKKGSKWVTSEDFGKAWQEKVRSLAHSEAPE